MKKKVVATLFLFLGFVSFVIYAAISAAVGYPVTLGIDKLFAKPELDVIMFSENEGNQFPITIDNTGKKTLTEIEVSILSCFMEYPKRYRINELKQNQNSVVPFEDRKTLENYEKHQCIQGKWNDTEVKVWLTPYKNKTSGKFFFPTVNTTRFSCGTCYWTINITAAEGYTTSFYEGVFSPIDMNFFIQGDDSINYSSPELESLTPIGMSVFDSRLFSSIR